MSAGSRGRTRLDCSVLDRAVASFARGQRKHFFMPDASNAGPNSHTGRAVVELTNIALTSVGIRGMALSLAARTIRTGKAAYQFARVLSKTLYGTPRKTVERAGDAGIQKIFKVTTSSRMRSSRSLDAIRKISKCCVRAATQRSIPISHALFLTHVQTVGWNVHAESAGGYSRGASLPLPRADFAPRNASTTASRLSAPEQVKVGLDLPTQIPYCLRVMLGILGFVVRQASRRRILKKSTACLAPPFSGFSIVSLIGT